MAFTFIFQFILIENSEGVIEFITVSGGGVRVDVGDVRTWNILRRKFKSNCNLLFVCNNNSTHVTSIDTEVFLKLCVKVKGIDFCITP